MLPNNGLQNDLGGTSEIVQWDHHSTPEIKDSASLLLVTVSDADQLATDQTVSDAGQLATFQTKKMANLI